MTSAGQRFRPILGRRPGSWPGIGRANPAPQGGGALPATCGQTAPSVAESGPPVWTTAESCIGRFPASAGSHRFFP